ncbi:FAD/NAD(P)-binding domain-containing protein [Pseudovirgaria hyperparasitica]|uniref:FAD/NAD(P)-binding domain-containing protein n=1 Tax=Pseudovirgaria hyperparasitica TaxID=470096 RepID=A0A6A6W8X5_9PEZI|nr:FAD/NAD(P)-binding domain-containing protein [Pseudovirgaria hyperparasitica]KAF2759302.1 FAD/NAD(P)-binding domain-containing protein [Pseudovirgaria hyperparasitica]
MSNTTTTTTTLPILIIGAGLAGLTLAQALRKQNIPFRIFERDASPTARPQGWAIALHSMLDELTTAMPPDVPSLDTTNHLLPLPQHTAQMALYSPSGTKHIVESTPSHKIIRANRAKLTQLLRTHIPVEYAKHLVSISEAPGAASVTAHFADGTHATGRVIVGADGVGSKVRAHILPDTHPSLVPVTLITGELRVRGTELAHQLSLARSAYVAFGPSNTHLFVGLDRISDDGAEGAYYWDMIIDAPGKSAPDAEQSAAEQLCVAKEMAAAFEPELTRLIHLTGEEGIHRPRLVLRDAVIPGMPRTRVTLMGDAAHPMTPFRGEGGCQAIRDALNLARVLIQSDDADLLANLDAYQVEMLQRGGEAVRRSRGAGSGEQDAGERMAWGTKLRRVVD